MEKFTFIEHTADVKYQAFGTTLEEAFSHAALALTHCISYDTIATKKEKNISIKGTDLMNLLYNFLEELIFYFDSEHFLLADVKKIHIDQENFTLTATLTGDTAEDYEMHSAVKAATYHDMFIKQEKGKWIAQVVLDI